MEGARAESEEYEQGRAITVVAMVGHGLEVGGSIYRTHVCLLNVSEE
jgi:hypothetical protein